MPHFPGGPENFKLAEDMAKKWKEYGIDVIWKNYTIMQCPGPRIWRQERLHCTMDLLWSTRQLLKKNSLFPQRTTAMWSHLSTLMHHQDPSGWVSITVFVLFRAFLVTRTISISINESPPKKMINKFSISCSWVIWKIITFLLLTLIVVENLRHPIRESHAKLQSILTC